MGEEKGAGDALENDDEGREWELEGKSRREEESDAEGIGGHFGCRCEAHTHRRGKGYSLAQRQRRTSDMSSRRRGYGGDMVR